MHYLLLWLILISHWRFPTLPSDFGGKSNREIFIVSFNAPRKLPLLHTILFGVDWMGIGIVKYVNGRSGCSASRYRNSDLEKNPPLGFPPPPPTHAHKSKHLAKNNAKLAGLALKWEIEKAKWSCLDATSSFWPLWLRLRHSFKDPR